MEISPSLSPCLPDMEISNDDNEVCEMDLCLSSPDRVDRPLTPSPEPLLHKLKSRDMETDEEETNALRSLLLAQVKPQAEKRDDLPDIEKNLKLAVLRLKQKKNNKVLEDNEEESKGDTKKTVLFIPRLPATNTIFIPDPPKSPKEQVLPSLKKPPSLTMVEESALLKSIAERIISDPNLSKALKLHPKSSSSMQKIINKSSKVSQSIVSLRSNKNTLTTTPTARSKYRIVLPPKGSTQKLVQLSEKERALVSSSMTDTKNIPLHSKKKLKRQSKLITSLDDCKRTVERLVINLNEESDESTDEKTVPSVPKNFQSNLDVFLKNIRHTGSSPKPSMASNQCETKDSVSTKINVVKSAAVSSFFKY